MAARTRKIRHDATTREKIRTSQLINRLTAHALGEADPQSGQPVELSATQVRAIEILLKKSLPDLTATEITNVEPQSLDEVSTDELIAALQEFQTDRREGHGPGLEEERGPFERRLMQPHTKAC
jgi:hypothetical protein